MTNVLVEPSYGVYK